MTTTTKPPYIEMVARARRERADMVRVLAEQLHETEPGVTQELARIVTCIGITKCRALLQETLVIEANGGLMVPDGSRRRTIGGVFFYLVRTKGPKHILRTLNRHFVSRKSSTSEAPIPSRPKNTPLSHDEIRSALRGLSIQKGLAVVQITVVGKPKGVTDQGSYVAMLLQQTKVPNLPNGLPTPPRSSSDYFVLISMRHWRSVVEALKDPEDILIVEGYAQVVPEVAAECITVFALRATTKKLQSDVADRVSHNGRETTR